MSSFRPESTEYGAHFEKYISLVPDAPIADTLAGQTGEALAFYRGITEAQAASRYAPDKWSIKQVLGHVIDTERIFGYRALSIGRGEAQALPGFDQDVYVANANFDDWSWSALIDDLAALREASVRLVRGFTPEMLARVGLSNKHPMSARAAAFVIAGHERYHIVRLKQDYLK